MRLIAIVILMIFGVPAHAQWREASSKHFVVYSQTSEKTLRAFAENLERYDAAMRFVRNLSATDPGKANRVTVFMVSGQSEVVRLAGGQRFVAGFYVPRAGGSIAIVPARAGVDQFDLSSENILLHEYAHHFMSQNFSSAYPGWFREGFAEFNASTRFERDGSVVIGNAPGHRMRGLHSGLMSVRKMLSLEYGKMRPDAIDALYARGWQLTHYLTFDPERKGQLTAYLAAINRGVGGLEAATLAFGDLEKLESDLGRYARRPSLPGIRIEPAAIPTPAIAIRTMSAAESAMMPIKIVSRRGVTADQAKALVPLARKSATPYPDDPFVQAALAEAEYDALNLDEAEAAADRALAVQPGHIDALIYKGRVSVARATRTKATGAEVWKDARSWLVKANRADPDHPEPLMLFYSSFASEGREPTANAVVGLNRAHDLAPYDHDLRMMAAYRYLADGKVAEARSAIAPVAFNPHRGSLGNWLTAVMHALDTEGAPAALALWKAGPASDIPGPSPGG